MTCWFGELKMCSTELQVVKEVTELDRNENSRLRKCQVRTPGLDRTPGCRSFVERILSSDFFDFFIFKIYMNDETDILCLPILVGS